MVHARGTPDHAACSRGNACVYIIQRTKENDREDRQKLNTVYPIIFGLYLRGTRLILGADSFYLRHGVYRLNKERKEPVLFHQPSP